MKKWITLSLFLLIGIATSFAQDDEYDNWVKLMADTMKNSLIHDNGKLVDSLFNSKIFAEKVFIKKDNDSLIQAFNERYYKNEFQEIQFGKLFSKRIKGTYYDYLNHYNSIHDDDLHIVFRLAAEDGGLNYHDFHLRYSTKDSSYQIIDVFFYTIGVNFSDIMSDLYKNDLRVWLNNKNRIFKKSDSSNTSKLSRINALLKEDKPQKAFNLYQEVPSNIQSQKTYRYLEIKILAYLNDSLFIEAAETYENDFPKDPSIYLIGLRKFMAAENYDMALKYLNKLDIKVGLDPFLNYERGDIYFLKKEYKKAQKYYEKAFKDFYYEGLYFSMFDLYFETNQVGKLISILDALISDFNYEKKDIIELIESEYSSLLSESEYQVWKKAK